MLPVVHSISVLVVARGDTDCRGQINSKGMGETPLSFLDLLSLSHEMFLPLLSIASPKCEKNQKFGVLGGRL